MRTAHLPGQASSPPLTRIFSPSTDKKNLSGACTSDTHSSSFGGHRSANLEGAFWSMDLQFENPTGKTCASASSRGLVIEPQDGQKSSTRRSVVIERPSTACLHHSRLFHVLSWHIKAIHLDSSTLKLFLFTTHSRARRSNLRSIALQQV